MNNLTKRTRHLATIQEEDITPENIKVVSYQDPVGNPHIPDTEIAYFGVLCEQTKGLFVQGGEIELKGKLKNTFKEYDYLMTKFNNWKIIWCRMHFTKPKYVTVFAWVMDKAILYLSADDGNIDYEAAQKAFQDPVQLKVFKEIIQLVAKEPLPKPPVTYDFY